MSEKYHLGELKVALDPNDPAHLLPPSLAPTQTVLDIGCGAGQTLIAAYPDRVTFGLDVDFDAVKMGRDLSQNVRLVCARAEALPWANETFDLVIARVSLPYTNLDQSLREVHRILRPGGRLWITLHPFSLVWEQAKRSNYKGKIFFLYILLNSALFHAAQRQIPFLGRYESFQTNHGITRALEKIGFRSISVNRGRHFLVTAELSR